MLNHLTLRTKDLEVAKPFLEMATTGILFELVLCDHRDDSLLFTRQEKSHVA